MRLRAITALLAFTLSALLSVRVRADDVAFFTARVAPVLKERCLPCHNPQKRRGGLDLSTRGTVLKGGNEGSAVLPGQAEESLLLRQVSGPRPKMPKQGPPLASEEVAALRTWIEQGMSWPDNVVLAEAGPKSRVGPDWWSLRPLARPPLPAVRQGGWMRTPIDAFVLAALEARAMRPSPEADRLTLIRRVTFDLHGLPPTPDEAEAFVNDPDPDAYEKLIERLLDSPHYGERWGRHWLDVVHYGDTHGYDKDKRRDFAWLYRDYVIGSLNQDKPYGQFTKEQIAGDVLYPDGPEGIIATGFIAAGPWDFVAHTELREGTVEKEKTRVLDRDDMVANTIATFNSLTVHCARCHDHKFDPIPQRDYYRLQAVFAGVDRGNRPYLNRELYEHKLALEKRRQSLAAAHKELLKQTENVTNAERTAAELAALDEQIRSLPASKLVYSVLPHAPRPIAILPRGDVEHPGEAVQAGALACVPGLESAFRLAQPENEGARRAALAEWLASPQNVLTWRSIVNRVWHYHFGRGIVDTPNDFGWNGGRPTHPQLLDWLAVEFRDGGQSLKALHRLILRSATYRQASRHDTAFAKLDADNRLLWRMNRQRLDAESVRDAVLAISNHVDRRMGGPGFELFRFKDDHSPFYDHTAVEKIHDPAGWRRTVYRFVVRSVPNPFLDCLDSADPNLNTPVRNMTLTALQALALLNDPFMVKQAELFAERLRTGTSDTAGQIDRAYRLAFGRAPTAEERALLQHHAGQHGLASACRLLFNANEFVFID